MRTDAQRDPSTRLRTNRHDARPPVLRLTRAMLAVSALGLLGACGQPAKLSVDAVSGRQTLLTQPRTSLLPTVDIAPATGWASGQTPRAIDGMRVQAFATGLAHPRWLAVLPNGDVLVAESDAPTASGPGSLESWVASIIKRRAGSNTPGADRLRLLRDADGDGVAEQRAVLLDGLHSPFGMALIGEWLYVANTDAVLRVRLQPGSTRIDEVPEVVATLPAGPRNQHWTRNLLASRDERHLYVTVGSASNIAEHGMQFEQGRAAIHRLDLASGRLAPFASGLRNPNGLAIEPRTGALWTTVNERDELGGDLVPDYLTRVEEGDFFGWPWSYWGGIADDRVTAPRPAEPGRARVPDYALGPHVAALGLVFADRATAMPPRFREGALIGLHGSWNRRPKSGYRVVHVRFEDGLPVGKPVTVLDGFLDEAGENARGRPVGVAIGADGGLLVADDVGGTIWHVSAAAPTERTR